MNKAKIAKQNRQRGKRIEKRIAKIMDGKRMGLFGMEDVETDKFSIEVKLRKKFTGLKWMEQAERNNIDHKIPIVTIQLPYFKDNDILVMMRMKDFINQFGIGERIRNTIFN